MALGQPSELELEESVFGGLGEIQEHAVVASFSCHAEERGDSGGGRVGRGRRRENRDVIDEVSIDVAEPRDDLSEARLP